MFICMAAGELIVDPRMFNGFLQKPQIWPFVFIETVVWLIPFMLIIVPALNRLAKFSERNVKLAITLSWISVGLSVACAYKMLYYPGDWSLHGLFRHDIVFGWSIPYTFILVFFIIFSRQYVSTRKSFQTSPN